MIYTSGLHSVDPQFFCAGVSVGETGGRASFQKELLFALSFLKQFILSIASIIG
jgi:hypothetical protein